MGAMKQLLFASGWTICLTRWTANLPTKGLRQNLQTLRLVISMLEFRKSQTALICRPKSNVNTFNSPFFTGIGGLLRMAESMGIGFKKRRHKGRWVFDERDSWRFEGDHHVYDGYVSLHRREVRIPLFVNRQGQSRQFGGNSSSPKTTLTAYELKATFSEMLMR